MKAILVCQRPFHMTLLANVLQERKDDVTLLSSAPRRFFKGLDPGVKTRFAPAPFSALAHFTRKKPSPRLETADRVIFDRMCELTVGKPDVCIGLAIQCLYTGKAVKRRGGYFVLDRACPHVDFQEGLMKRESERLGVEYQAQPSWFRDRQLQEYEEADAIIVPSRYSGDTFPEHLQSKIVLAPLLGRTRLADGPREEKNEQFTVGVVGGDPRRKGYLYLLQAWKKMALPNAKLLIRAGSGFESYPALDKLMGELQNVELLGYIPDISDFYRRCDVFVLPTIDDGFGMALFEAMANYAPCITTSNCGAAELLKHDEDAIVVEPASAEQLEEAILRLYRSEELRREIGETGFKAVERIAAGRLYANAIESMLAKMETGSLRLARSNN